MHEIEQNCSIEFGERTIRINFSVLHKHLDIYGHRMRFFSYNLSVALDVSLGYHYSAC